MATTGPDRADAAFWATYLRNRNVDVATANDGAVAVAGGFAIYAAGSAMQLAFAAGSSRPLLDDDVTAIEAFYRARGAPVRLEAREDVLERDRAVLERHGFTPYDAAYAFYETHAPPGDAGGGATVRAASDRAAWARLVASAFADGGAPDATLLRTVEHCAAAAAGLFVAEIDGAEAGAAALGISGEYALLYCGAVLPAFRRRGVHRALLYARIANARARGFARATIRVRVDSAAEASARAAGFAPTLRARRVQRA